MFGGGEYYLSEFLTITDYCGVQDYVVEGPENIPHVLEGRDNLAVDPVQFEDNSNNYQGELKLPRNYQETTNKSKVVPVRSKQSQTDGIAATLYKTL